MRSVILDNHKVQTSTMLINLHSSSTTNSVTKRRHISERHTQYYSVSTSVSTKLCRLNLRLSGMSRFNIGSCPAFRQTMQLSFLH
jgi:CTP synthase (UTP-ammonia lyase)